MIILMNHSKANEGILPVSDIGYVWHEVKGSRTHFKIISNIQGWIWFAIGLFFQINTIICPDKCNFNF